MVTLFDLSRNCAVYVRQELSGPKTLTPILGENFENLGVIDKRQFLNNHDELGLEISCIMLVHPASL